MSSIVNLFRRNRSDRDRFTSLVRPHVELMYRMAVRWTGNQADAEDLVQTVLTRLASRVAELEEVEQLRPWLIRVVYRQFVDQTRLARNRLEVVATDLEPHPEQDPESGHGAPPVEEGGAGPAETLAQQDQLGKALALLGDDQRAVILLHDAEGYTMEEVAEILDINTGTVKSRLHRARVRVKKFINEGTL